MFFIKARSQITPVALMPRNLIGLFIVLLMLVVSDFAQAKPDTASGDGLDITGAQKQLTTIEKALEKPAPDIDLDDAWKSLSLIRQMAKNCIAEQNLKIEKLGQSLTELGESIKGEDWTVNVTRKNMEKERQSTDAMLSNCKLLSVKSETLLEDLGKRREKILKERLLTRYPNLINLLLGKGEEPVQWRSIIGQVQFGPFGVSHIDSTDQVILVFITLLGVAAIVYLQTAANRYLSRHIRATDFSSALINSLLKAFQRYSIGLILFSVWGLFWFLDSLKNQQVAPLGYALLTVTGFFLVQAVGRTFFAPISPAVHFLPQSEENCQRFWKGLRLLSVVITTGILINLLPISANLPDPLEILLRLVFVTLVVFSLVWVIWSALTLYGRRGLHLARFLLILALATGLTAEIAGYRNLSEYLIGGIFFSLFLIGIAWLLSMLFADFCDSLDEGRYRWEISLRSMLGVESKGYLPGVFWLRMLGILFLWGGTVLILLRIWDVSAAKRDELLAYVTDGFVIGEVAIKPARIVIALGILVILMSVISWFKKQLDDRWLKKSRMDAGARNAVASVTSYAAAAVAIIVALGFAGVELSNLAIIAGALSVGIGFGLQNIVNNFVSGLILLFERPVQKGDWIVVGNTEGYVRKISIRSTQIQTFDRADVIVPNSELISAQVTNWMLRDLRGRVRAPIGIAYGSDVNKVKEILLEIAYQQPGAILDGSVTEPKVLFLGFGDNSLNFELRFIIHNVDEKMQILSDVNFAIEKAFRENNIEIPFPQRDLHIRSWDKESRPDEKSEQQDQAPGLDAS